LNIVVRPIAARSLFPKQASTAIVGAVRISLFAKGKGRRCIAAPAPFHFVSLWDENRP
jgi:hypothetical protein